MNKYIKYTLLITGIACFTTSLRSEDEAIYTERFTNVTGENVLFATEGNPYTWSSIYRIAAGDGWHGISPTVGIELDFTDADFGFIFMYTRGDLPTEILALSNVPLDRDEQEITRVSWAMRDTDVDWAQETSLAVKIGGTWYVSTDVQATPTNSTFPTFSIYETQFDTSAGSWRILSVDDTVVDFSDENMALGDVLTTDLPSGDIENWGFFSINLGGESTTIDEVIVYAGEKTGSSDPDGNDWYSVADESVFGTVWAVSANYVWFSKAGWVYMIFSGGPNSADGGYFAYSYEKGGWLWLVEDFGGWYYNYTISGWENIDS